MALNPEENRLYSKASDLHPLHWEKLAARNPEEAARSAGAMLESGVYLLRLAGSLLRIDPATRRVGFAHETESEPGYQRALVAVSYLGSAIDAPAAGKLVSPRELPGGQGFFRGPHAVPTSVIAKAYSSDAPGFLRAGERIGGIRATGGDASFTLALLPRIPAQAILWVSDGEMGAEAAILLDARASLFAPLDVLWAAMNVLAKDIVDGW